ncbi:MAG: NAD(P)-binding protein, partial [Salibacteraceae bacterium]
MTAAGCMPRRSAEEAEALSFPIHLHSNRKVGHLARQAFFQPVAREIATEVVVVGGGISGLAAAASLPHQDFVLLELGPQLGGTSSATAIGAHRFAQGAHYDLSYPSNFGREGLALLERLNIVQYDSLRDWWTFKDRQYLIRPEQEERCYLHGKLVPSVFPDSELKKNFLDLLRPYAREMPLPSTAIDPQHHWLDHLNFASYLKKYLPVTPKFMESIDYQMLDDYGATAEQVSALAGVHYYRCRPYFETPAPELFSPTEGNYYFIQKLANGLPADQLRTQHLVTSMAPEGKGWTVDVWNNATEERIRYRCSKVIYTGQKHLLKYIYSDAYPAFEDILHSPWMVINLELNRPLEGPAIWQNDFLSENGQFLGFVNSGAQQGSEKQVLTAYYCYPYVYPHLLQEAENEPDAVVDQTLEFLKQYFQQDLRPYVQQAVVKVMGHAMPIPAPGYLSKKRPLEMNGLAFAGSDSGRLPLMFDCLDSGIQAAKR